MRRPGSDRDVFFSSPNIIPLFWEDEQLRSERPLIGVRSRMAEITILHTNDLHSSVDGRQGSDGKVRGGLGRIATTIQRARAAEPTLVCDVGDFVFGGGTWWDIQGAGAVGDLLTHDFTPLGNPN